MLRCAASFTTSYENQVYHNLCKVQLNDDTYGKVMFDISVKQGCPHSSTLFILYINELGTFLDKIDVDSLCLFSTMFIILLYTIDIVLLSKSRACLQSCYTCYTSFSKFLVIMMSIFLRPKL